jgi:alpha-D-xyloside xylohydrolase
LLPYLYSLAGAVTHQAGTLLRPLVMDFPGDREARAIRDEYLFGPELLVAPITAYRARSRAVYLPGDPTAGRPLWYDFWTGAAITTARLDAAAPLDAIPVFARAGSIVPLGPELQFTDEKPADPIALQIYGGADGAFTLYEDDGQSYGYERGQLARIPLRWEQATRTLTLGARVGSFPGMLASRRFDVVLIEPGRPRPFSFDPEPDRVVNYDGRAQTVTLAPQPSPQPAPRAGANHAH